ncbi:MAG TPA: transglycosylase SLT domain-containing protein, partial [Bryobacteraceae bacterium]|nr:transglycosylase SLT domain-containing protein [Bryobacteraceae bacterium]
LKFWAGHTLGRWFNRAIGGWRLAALALVCSLALSAQTFEGIADRYRKTPTPAARAAVLRYAQSHRDQTGALALLLLGATEDDQRQFGDALTHLNAASKRLPELADYIAYLTAVADSGLRQFNDTEPALQPVWHAAPSSPLVGKAVALQAEAYLQNGNPAGAAALVEQHLRDLAVPQAELLLARAYEAQNNAEAAAQHYQKIYIEYPLSKEASDAEAALTRYPSIPAEGLFARGLKLEAAGDYTRAGKELTAVLPRLSSVNFDLARVRIGAAAYLDRENESAYKYLTSFQATTPDGEAERLYYVLECQRRLNRLDEMNATLAKLSQTAPQSHWRLEGLVSVGNYYIAHDQQDAAQPLFRTCFESFGMDPESSACHWKVTWWTYLHDPAQAEPMLREHLTRYGASDQATAALYYLGRIAESKSDWATARAYYDAVSSAYPNYYYAILARDRLETPSLMTATASSATAQFLLTSQIANRHAPETFDPTPATKQRIARAHLLDTAGLDDLAEAELRFGAKADGQPQVIAIALAEIASERDAPDQAIRYIKHYAPGYLSLPIDSAPDKFWRLAFPLPYRKSLETYCREEMLDPYLMAALIRQESEFNPKAVSRANARGLAQVMPGTGRQLSRKLGLHYRTAMLFSPDTNLKLGTYYLKQLSDELQGKPEAALASYNAGKTHVTAWLAAANYREPSEFVESIPFNETRNYVQSVLRNAEVYRRLYGPKLAVTKQ